MPETKALSVAQSAEAVQATAVAAEAVEKARAAQMADVVDERLEAFFKRGIEGERFIPLKSGMMADKERFQFICDKIAKMADKIDGWDKSRVTRESLAEVADELAKEAVTKTDFALLKQQSDLMLKVFGIVGTALLLAIVGAIMTVILK